MVQIASQRSEADASDGVVRAQLALDKANAAPATSVSKPAGTPSQAPSR